MAADDAREPISLTQLRALLDAYGADAERWPAAARPPALALLEASADARAVRDEAARMDALLDLVPAHEPSARLRARILADAPRGVVPSRRLADRRWRLMATLVPLAIAAAAVLWLIPRSTRTAESPQVQYAIEDLGTYTTPTDVLLQAAGIDMMRSAPAIGCGTDGLACTIGDATVEPQSARERERRTA